MSEKRPIRISQKKEASSSVIRSIDPPIMMIGTKR